MRKIRKIEPAAPLLVQKKKVAAYARVSMESERLMHSLSAQVSFYSSLIQGNPEWEYAGVYVDSGVSGTSMAGRTAHPPDAETEGGGICPRVHRP